MCQFVELVSHKVISKNLISCIFFIQHWFSFALKFFHCAAWLISCFAETTIKAIKSKTSWNCALIFMVSVLSSHILHLGIYPRVVLIPNTTCLYTHKTGFTNVVFRNKHFKQNNMTISITKQMQYNYLLILLYVTFDSFRMFPFNIMICFFAMILLLYTLSAVIKFFFR